jgi:hypothetical protein
VKCAPFLDNPGNAADADIFIAQLRTSSTVKRSGALSRSVQVAQQKISLSRSSQASTSFRLPPSPVATSLTTPTSASKVQTNMQRFADKCTEAEVEVIFYI